MEQPLEFLKSKITDFPGFSDDVSRWRADELVRSYVGEAIADLQHRLQPPDTSIDGRIGDMLIRVGFANPAVYKTFEDGARAKFDAVGMAAADARAVEVADRGPSIDAAALPAFLDEITVALDQRDAVTTAMSTATI